ncbi:MAG: phosphatase PAP2 family protein [Ilumatobacter sp.]
MNSDDTDDEVPGSHHLGPHVERFDDIIDRLLERVRGYPVADRVFTTASHVGDFSAIWHGINLLIGFAERKPRRVLTFAALIGLESLVVNQGIKRLFRRPRPTTTGDDGLRVRTPSTSSFPSGHASSATFAAALLAPRVTGAFPLALRATAGIVATSRAYVRIHHASDVVAGFFTGALLVAGTRRILRRVGAADLI